MREPPSFWYEPHPLAWLLAPLGWITASVALLRRGAYRVGLMRSISPGRPVIVVGNVVAGGTGKTPLVIWLARWLASNGLRPAVICRGYGGNASSWPQQVRAGSDPLVVGDEAVLLARLSGCPVAAGPDRLAAAVALGAHADCDVIVSDDGLQHYRLARAVEIAVIDGIRRHGNGRCLPAGPLREPVSRLRSCDLVVTNGGAVRDEVEMSQRATGVTRLDDSTVRKSLRALQGHEVHAVCGIGHPERFFRMLEGHGLRVERHAFPDHHPFVPGDLEFDDDHPVLMTEKDAVKCARFATDSHWVVPIDVHFPPSFEARLREILTRAGIFDAGGSS